VDPYKVLGVSEDANKDQLKKAYRKLAAQHHPDKGGDEDKFKEANEAYSILSDDQKRQQYHEMKNGPQSNMGDMGGFGDIFNAFSGFGFDPFSELFGQRTQSGRQEAEKHTADKDIVFNLKISLDNIKKGSIKNINFQRNVICTDCSGEGGEGRRACPTCGGAGIEMIRPNAFVVQQIACRTCGGAGHGFTELCSNCHGRGFHRIEQSVQVEIKEKK